MKSQRATILIRDDHKKVDQLYQQYKGLNPQSTKKQSLAEQICHELEVHAQLEESIFYPALRAKLGNTGKDLISEALKEHGEMKHLIHQLRVYSTDVTECDKSLHTLMQGVQHHVREEESEMLPAAEEHLSDDLARLGMEMQHKKKELTASSQPKQKAKKGSLAQRLATVDKDTSTASNIEQLMET